MKGLRTLSPVKFLHANVLVVLGCVFVPVRLAQVSSNFPNCRLKLDEDVVLVSDVDAVELPESLAELIDCKFSNNCEK
jgi:hypothetical protein